MYYICNNESVLPLSIPSALSAQRLGVAYCDKQCCDVCQGIGLPLEEAMRFWRTEFGPRTPSDAFDKQYAYNVRYNYGKEGKRTNYTPYSCVKIISSTPGQVLHTPADVVVSATHFPCVPTCLAAPSALLLEFA